MAGSIERLSFKKAVGQGASEATIALHMERYHFAAKQVKGSHVLDLACGVGYGSRILLKAGAASVTGIDIAPEAIEEAQSTGEASGLTFYCLDYRRLQSPNNLPPSLAERVQQKFDVIVSLETIEHLPDPDDFIKTVTAHLPKGGKFIGSVPVTPSMDANPYHLQDFSPNSFRELLERQGLRVIDNLRQRQPYNPVTVKSEMESGERQGLRENLSGYYISHPSKLALRLWSSVRYGFVNLYDVNIAEKLS